jgi:hypothetical protein
MSGNSFTNIFTGNPVWAANVSYVSLSITANTTLNWPTQFLDVGNVVGGWTAISVNNSGYSITLPNATLASVGQSIVFINTSSSNFSFMIKDNGGTTLATISLGQAVTLLLRDTTTAAGSWLIFPFAQGMTAVTSVGATTSSAGLTIGGSPITSAGNLVFTLASGLQAVANLNATGIMVQSAIGPSIMTTVSLVGGTNIDVTNGDGTLGNPTIDLSDTLVGLVSAQIGSLTISNNTVATTSGNVPIQITPNGTGSILLGSGLTPPTVTSTGNITNISTISSVNANISTLLTATNATITTQLDAAQFRITGNAITNSNTNGSVALNANGTGTVVLAGNTTYPFTVASTGLTTHPSIVKNWVVFSGTTGTILKSYNVASVVRNSAGTYTVTWPSIATGSHPVILNVLDPALDVVWKLTSQTNTIITFTTKNLSGTLVDPTFIYVVSIDSGP